MKKLFASAALAASLVFPAGIAQAAEPGSPVEVQQCPTGDVGIIVWATDPKTGTRFELVHACVLVTQ